MHYDLDLCPEINKAHPQLNGSRYVKFYDDRCKGKAIMDKKNIFSNQCIVTFTFDPKSIGNILNSMGVDLWSFTMIGVKGKQLIIMHKQEAKRATSCAPEYNVPLF